jgi:hypothetical protein
MPVRFAQWFRDQHHEPALDGGVRAQALISHVAHACCVAGMDVGRHA